MKGWTRSRTPTRRPGVFGLTVCLSSSSTAISRYRALKCQMRFLMRLGRRSPRSSSTTRVSMSRLVDFCRGLKTDTEGRLLEDILAWPDDDLEEVHDFIQWLFP